MADERTKYKTDYARKKYKRVPLDLRKEDYEELQALAAELGEPINAFIKKAIAMRMSWMPTVRQN